MPDFDKLKNKANMPAAHFTANAVLSVMTAVVSLALAITLYALFLGKDETPIAIYLTAGFLTAMFFWQAQVLWRTLLLKKQFPGLKRKTETRTVETAPLVESVKTQKLLNEADLTNVVLPNAADAAKKSIKL